MKVVTFGELMIRLQPYNYERFVQADHLEFTFGGGEANVAVSLANYGADTVFVTKLPAHAIGQAAVNSLRRYGVDTSKIVRGGDRVGIYFNEKGASQRPSVCIYDRAHSAIQESDPSEFNWDEIFEGADWFHFTGITPALGPNMVTACLEACKVAKEHGVKISCDLNYRGKLWTRDQARAAMTELCKYVDVCISNEEDAKDVFGIEAENTDITAGALNKEGYKSVARQLADKFGFEKVAITLRESKSAFDNDWSAMLYDVKSDEYCFSKLYHLHIIDRIGGGDSFGGGLIYALLSGHNTQSAVEFAVAASALKHSIEGDYNFATVPEVEKLAGGDAVMGYEVIDDEDQKAHWIDNADSYICSACGSEVNNPNKQQCGAGKCSKCGAEMESKAIEDALTEEDDMDKQDKPRLAEVLGVEVGEEFIIREGPVDYKCVIKQNGEADLSYWKIGYAINHPESIIRAPRLTEPEITIMRAVGARWVSRNEDSDYGFVELWQNKPHCIKGDFASGDGTPPIASVLCSLFPSVEPGECIELEDIEK